MTALPSNAVLTSDTEPNILWKTELSDRIHEFAESMLMDAKNDVEAKFARGPIALEERERITSEYTDAVGSIRKLAVEVFKEELEREGQECQRKLNEALLPRWDEAFKQQQQEIMDMIENGEEEYSDSDSDSDVTEPGTSLAANSVPSRASTPTSDDEDESPEFLPRVHPPSPAIHIPTTPHPQYEPDIEPNGQWKAGLRTSVEDSLRPLVDTAKSTLESKLRSPWIGAAEREHAATEYEEALAHARNLAAEAFQAQLEHERQERRWLKVKDLLLNSVQRTLGGFTGDETEKFLLQAHPPTSTTPRLPTATDEWQAKQGDTEYWSMSLEDFWKLAKYHLRQWNGLEEMDHLRWKDFPWPTMKSLSMPDDMTYTAIEFYLFYPFCVKPYEIGLLKDHIWFLVTTWHPDHFDNLFSKVIEQDKASVTQMYRYLMRTLHDVLTLSDSSLFKVDWWPPRYAQTILEATIKREREVRRRSEGTRTWANARGRRPEVRSWGETVDAEKVSGSNTTESDSSGSNPQQTGEKKRRFEGYDENASGKQKWKKVQHEEGSIGDAGISETSFGHDTSSLRIRAHEGAAHASGHLSDISRIMPIVERLEQAFEDIDEYKRLLLCRGLQAQMVLDLLQTVSVTVVTSSFTDEPSTVNEYT